MSYFERIKKDGRKANPFFCLTGIDIVKAEPGKAVLTMPVRPDMHNGVGWLQGGMLVAIADEAMALALYPLLEKNEGIATIAESTSFIRGVQNGTILAEARVIRKGRRVAFMEAEVWAEGGEKVLLSRTTASFAITSAQ
jgi:acyl-CoA thioesterase